MTYAYHPIVLSLLVGAGFALVYLPLSIMLTSYFARREADQQSEPGACPEEEAVATLSQKELEDLLTQLHLAAGVISTEVNAHSAKMDKINRQLDQVEKPSIDTIRKAVAQVKEANEQVKSQLSEARQTIEHQAAVINTQMLETLADALTGIGNRRVFDHELQRRLAEWHRKQRPFALMMWDVDHFKRFNDTYGHLAGDEVLRRCADLLSTNLREMDLAVRYGGEEFAVIMPDTTLLNAAIAGDRVRNIIAAERFLFDEQETSVQVSYGVAEVVASDDENSIVKRADNALYASKNAGRNCGHVAIEGRWEPVTKLLRDASEATHRLNQETAAAAESPGELAGETVTGGEGRSSRRFLAKKQFVDEVRQRVAETRRYGNPLSAVLLAIDDYDKIDAAGPNAAPLVNRVLAQFVDAAVRDSDIVARYGPDQFALLLLNADLDAAVRPARRLRVAAAACDNLLCRGAPLRFTLSIGVAEVTADEDADQLLARLEQTAHQASAWGKNCIFASRDSAPARVDDEDTAYTASS